MAFGEPITVAPGAEVRVANNDSVEHSVTSQAEGMFDTHVDGQQKGTFTAPTQPGEYPFYCVYHPSMKGTLIVE
ncbi:cupredoxin domain-containing protein [Mycolicibacterium agri]|nr:cupredoxin domain-containing protein [Mycolicibacterium agri]